MSTARYRKFSDKDSTFLATVTNRKNGSVISSSNLGPYELNVLFDDLSDVNDPDFRRRAARGDVIVHPFHRFSTEFSSESGSHTSTFVDAWNTWTTTWNGAMMPHIYNIVTGSYANASAIMLPDDYFNEVGFWLRDHRRRIAADLERSRYAFGEDVAEIRKSLASIAGLLNTIKNIIVRIPALTETYVRNGYTLNKAASKVWLRLRYELRPLLISAENMLKIANGAMTLAIGKRQKVTAFDPFHLNQNRTFTKGSPTSGDYWVISRTDTVEGKINSGQIFENSDPLKTDLEHLGLGMKDIAPTLWAITRFSFLVDKFINISNIIRGMQNTLDPDIKMLGGWQTVSYSYEGTSTVKYSRGGTGFSSTTNPYKTVMKVTDKDRSTMNISFTDVLNLDFTMPDWETFADLYSIFVSPKLRGTKLRV